MPGPPEPLEKMVGWFLPPASREEVLGDLHEQYRSVLRYVWTPVRVIPSVAASRVRRTSDFSLLVTEAMLAYAAFLGVAWWMDRPLLYTNRGLELLFVPALMTFIDEAVEAAWRRPDGSLAIWLPRTWYFSYFLLLKLPGGVFFLGCMLSILLGTCLKWLVPATPRIRYSGLQPAPASLPDVVRWVGLVSVLLPAGIMAGLGWKYAAIVIGTFLGAAVLGKLKRL